MSARCEDEIALYIQHRLHLAGMNGAGPNFTEGGVKEITQYSKGIPRLINVVCDKSLLTAYVMEKKSIDSGIVKQAINDIEGGLLS